MPSTKQQLRRVWFQLHKWIGLLLAILIIPVSLTGSALVWHDWLDETLNPERAASGTPALTLSGYAAAARAAATAGEKLVSVAVPAGEGAVVATLARPPSPGGGRPVRTTLHLDPKSGEVLDRTASNEGAVHVLHVLHGSLMVPGVGRQIVGWIGVAMTLSALSGLWLWWPLKGGIRRGLRWKRQPTTSGNLHHQGGFWIAIPLAILSITGAWISFPAFFTQISGDPAGPSPAERMRRMAAVPLAETNLRPEAAAQAAARFGTGTVATVTWPTDKDGSWKIASRENGRSVDVAVDDGTGTAKPPKPAQPETIARLMRRIHDGTGTGPVWQTIIFIGGIIPAALAVTGILMWLNVRRRRRTLAERRQAEAHL